MSFYSPLRYPGGKGKLAKYVQNIIVDNNLLDGTYVEPFAGGAGVALSLLFNEYVSSIVINDISKAIYSFWYSVIYKTDELCKLITDTQINIEEWKLQKHIQQNLNDFSEIELGFSTFFLNRTNRSGIINAGVIGGLKQDGEWKMDARYKTNDLIKRIEKIAMYNDRIKLYNLDVIDIIDVILPGLPENTLVYLDPPYYNKGAELYMNFYHNKDHAILSKAICERIKHNWIVTYDNTPEIRELYNEYRQRVYQLNYSASKKIKGSEIMVFSNDLNIPNESLQNINI